MKYLRKIFILCTLLIFSAEITTFASTKIENNNMASNIKNININDNIINNASPDADEVVEVFNYNDNKIYLTEYDINLMAQVVYAESKGEPYEGKVAVASVILNRVLSPGFPNSIEEVVFQPNAFSCVIDGKISVTPTQECYDAVYDAIRGNDPTNEALFFYNPETATCSWMTNIEKTQSTSIGRHLFFNTK
ncbi:cell wall hydrolase [Clostridium isatidis]|uniref:Cell wall hydrolase n=1 Tax=Clostridium isatidis TaxID=182773 RepID=A0A343J9J3_9CLOT|nr:cell wall hydrolase [Clostridium isatidis]ASW42201.1 cell wall hydrolase [Clostridium isatidis]NLZ34478.1 cell wall hydrolase [Clostridiales bacterium]